MKLKRVAIAIVPICFFITTAYAAQISVEPAYQEVSKGDSVVVDIVVDPAENEVYGASYTLYFNGTLLSAISQVPGPFLTRDGNDSTIFWNKKYDDRVEYAESKMETDVGIRGDSGNLATITFDVIGEEGISLLNIGDLYGELLYSTSGPVPTTICNGRVGIAQPSTPFLISGYVFYENESVCNTPAVNITNMNICEEWTAETNETSNYYQIMLLASCADVIAGDVLRFNAVSPDGSKLNVTEHNVTLDEVHNGGLFDFNITLDLVCGDIDGNGVINILDVRLLSNHVSNGYPINEWIGDVNCDGGIDGTDVRLLLTYVFSGSPPELKCYCG